MKPAVQDARCVAMELPQIDSAPIERAMTVLARGRWGRWLLSCEPTPWDHDGLTLRHEDTDYIVQIEGRGASDAAIARVASKPWATAEDVGQLVFALRDVAQAYALGLLP